MLSINFFPNFIIRTPIYHINTISNDFNIDKLRDICNNPLIQEAIYLASQSLYSDMMKFCKDQNFNNERVILSLVKYLTRLSTRCTPFGLFSGCSLGNFSDKTQLNRSYLDIQRKTTIDNLLLGSLILDYESRNKDKIFYFPNNSIYILGDQLRYTEYRYTSYSKQHFLSAIANTEVLSSIFKFCHEGKSMYEIVNFIYSEMHDEVSYEDVEEYVSELINNQIVVSNLSPIVVGKKNTLEYLIEEVNSGIFSTLLYEIKNILNKIDNCSEEKEQMYYYVSLEDKIKDYEKININTKYIFQSDILIDFKHNTINYEEYQENLLEAIKILNKLSNNYTSPRMKSFKERFYQRYENQQIPFAEALDTENGIKYGEGKDYDLSGFVDDVKRFVGHNSFHQVDDIHLNRTERFLLKKIYDTDLDIVEIEAKELDNFTENWDNVPDTFSVVCNLHQEAMSLKFVGGTSASCLLGRFGYLDWGIENLIEEIYIKEEQVDKIIAEIVHLPEDRTGNILYRYNTRKYEIPYLGLSSKKAENQILIDDLMIYLEDDQVKIRSKKINREVIPKLSNAHNFSSPMSVPIYQFLCDLQMQNTRVNMNLEVSTILSLLRYIPRIQYKNIILSEKQWLFTQEDISELSKKDNFYHFLKTKRITNNFYLVEGDNELYVNIKNALSVKMFLQTVKNRDFITLKESLYDEFSSKVVDVEGNHYANEVIISYYKDRDERK